MNIAVLLTLIQIGKRVKSSKVRHIWRFALRCDNYKTHQVTLKHSLFSGKREVHLDEELVFGAKKMFGGKAGHVFGIDGCRLCVVVEDTTRGYVYDLHINYVSFAQNPRISIEKLERLRAHLSKENDSSARCVNPQTDHTKRFSRLPAQKEQSSRNSVKSAANSGLVFSETYSPDRSLFSNHSSPLLSEKSDINQTNDRFPDFDLPQEFDFATTQPLTLEKTSPPPQVNQGITWEFYAQPYNGHHLAYDISENINLSAQLQTQTNGLPGAPQQGLCFEDSRPLLGIPQTVHQTNYVARQPELFTDPISHLVNLDDIRQPAPVDLKKQNASVF